MQWEDREESGNVEDQRGLGPVATGGIAAGGGGLLLLVVALLFGVDPRQLGQVLKPPQREAAPGRSNKQVDPRQDKIKRFAGVILKDTEDVWDELFRQHRGEFRRSYEQPRMVLFTGGVRSGCGEASSQVGPFYCPADSRVYLDLTFFEELERRLGAPGEFARAYVIAHEVGHHVQNLLGYSRLADKMRGKRQENEYSVRLELQADYLAGVWAHHIQKKYRDKYEVINQRDIKEGINAAIKIGDDYLQSRGGRGVSPEKFTHGTSEARAYWLSDGLKTGDFSKQKLDGFFELPYNRVDVGLDKVRGR